MSRVARLARVIVVPAILLGLWQLVAAWELVDAAFLPAPGRTVEAGRELWENGRLVEAARFTVGRALLGWTLASVAGVMLAVAVTRSRHLADVILPLLDFPRSIPAAAVIPPATLLLGYGRSMHLAVVVFAAIWPVLLGAAHGIAFTERQLHEVAKSIRMSRLRTIWSIELPSAVPAILLGARTSLGIAMIVAVVAEMLAAGGGLGYELIQASRRFRSPDVYALVFVLGVIGVVASVALQTAERRVLRRITGLRAART